jgi:energy-coupling factor transporter transmembrane protein EcfT
VDNFNLSYQHGLSPLHKLSPYTKLILILSISCVAIFNISIYIAILLFFITLASALFLTNISFKIYWSFGRVVLPFVIIISTVFPFFYGGQASMGSADIAISTPIKDLSWAAITFGALLGLRFLTLCIAGLTFAFTTHPSDLVQNLSERGWDYRYVHAPVLGLILFPRFIKLALDILLSQKVRNLGFGLGSIKLKLLRFRHLVFAMLVLGLRNGQVQAMALDVRGYAVKKDRTYIRKSPGNRITERWANAVLLLSIAYLIFHFNPDFMQWNI